MSADDTMQHKEYKDVVDSRKIERSYCDVIESAVKFRFRYLRWRVHIWTPYNCWPVGYIDDISHVTERIPSGTEKIVVRAVS